MEGEGLGLFRVKIYLHKLRKTTILHFCVVDKSSDILTANWYICTTSVSQDNCCVSEEWNLTSKIIHSSCPSYWRRIVRNTLAYVSRRRILSRNCVKWSCGSDAEGSAWQLNFDSLCEQHIFVRLLPRF